MAEQPNTSNSTGQASNQPGPKPFGKPIRRRPAPTNIKWIGPR